MQLVLFSNQVTVEAKMEHKSANSRFYQEWSNKYTLPEKADTAKIKSILDHEGILRIEAPRSASAEELPINITFNKQ